MEKAFSIIILVIVSAVLLWAVKIGAEKQVAVDCYKWQEYEQNFALFELEADLVAMCADKGIIVK